MHLTGYSPGTEAADSMVLYINKDPEVDAGPDTSIEADESVTMQGEVMYAYEYYWSSLGDGLFSDNYQLDAVYTPGEQDLINGQATLVLNAEYISPCTGTVTDSMVVFIYPVGVKELAGNDLYCKFWAAS